VQLFTAATLLSMQEDGLVSVSDPVHKHVDYHPHDPWETTSRGATLKDLASHM